MDPQKTYDRADRDTDTLIQFFATAGKLDFLKSWQEAGINPKGLPVLSEVEATVAIVQCLALLRPSRIQWDVGHAVSKSDRREDLKDLVLD